MFVLNLGVLLRWILAEYRHTLPLSILRHRALAMGPGICVLTLYIQKGQKRLPVSTSVVIDFAVVQFRHSKKALEVGPGAIS